MGSDFTAGLFTGGLLGTIFSGLICYGWGYRNAARYYYSLYLGQLKK